ncbi:S-adenosyl-L-methionine-dependent methyltransferase [Cladorrhinum sp. PSN259]|nr:S-adenosyl-L-methionine-dependent methyltransferase [Cladorrhinum sp. PSN259]
MSGSVSNWPDFFEKCYKNLKPGGWVEAQDLGAPVCDDGTYHEGLAIHKVITLLNAGLTAVGKGLVDVYKLKDFLKEAGFPEVKEKHGYWPSNSWPKDPKLKEIGTWANMSLSSGFEGFLLALGTRDMGWTPEEVAVLSAQARDDMNNRRIHTYWPVVIAYAQKPLNL